MRARARIELAGASDGGLTAPMPSPCQSLILRVEQNAEDGDEINLGVRISTGNGEPLTPDTADLAVQLDFWSDLADVFVSPGVSFTLRYPNRIVGRGLVLEVLPL